jgi:hypothetical protein
MQLREKVFSGRATPDETKQFYSRGDRIVRTILSVAIPIFLTAGRGARRCLKKPL